MKNNTAHTDTNKTKKSATINQKFRNFKEGNELTTDEVCRLRQWEIKTQSNYS